MFLWSCLSTRFKTHIECILSQAGLGDGAHGVIDMAAHGRDWKQRLVIASRDVSKFISNAYLLQKSCFQLYTFSNPVGHHLNFFAKSYSLNPDPQGLFWGP